MSVTEKGLYVLAAFCIVGIVVAYIVARANRTEAGLGMAIMSLLAITWLFVFLDVAVLILLGKGFYRRFRSKQMSIAVALLLFLILSVAVVLFLFTTCSVVVRMAD